MTATEKLTAASADLKRVATKVRRLLREAYPAGRVVTCRDRRKVRTGRVVNTGIDQWGNAVVLVQFGLPGYCGAMSGITLDVKPADILNVSPPEVPT